MSVPKFCGEATGRWEGTSSLSLPWQRKEPYDSNSSLHIEVGPNGSFAQIEYRWSYEGAVQHGVLLIAGNKKGGAVTVGWVDSWHQSPNVMNMTGMWDKDDAFSVLGHYSGGSGPEWGWRFELSLVGDILEFEMTNIHPDGKEDWAVRCHYKRS